MAVCFIIPPHILKEIAQRGSEEQKKRAEHSLMISQQIREKRQHGREQNFLFPTFEKNEGKVDPIVNTVKR